MGVLYLRTVETGQYQSVEDSDKYVAVQGLRGAYERAVKLCYGLSILGSVPLVILPFYNILLPMLGFGGSSGALGGTGGTMNGESRCVGRDALYGCLEVRLLHLKLKAPPTLFACCCDKELPLLHCIARSCQCSPDMYADPLLRVVVCCCFVAALRTKSRLSDDEDEGTPLSSSAASASGGVRAGGVEVVGTGSSTARSRTATSNSGTGMECLP